MKILITGASGFVGKNLLARLEAHADGRARFAGLPEEIEIIEQTRGSELVLELHVADGDMGKVIGRHGRIANSIRSVMKAAATANGIRINVEIRD